MVEDREALLILDELERCDVADVLGALEVFIGVGVRTGVGVLDNLTKVDDFTEVDKGLLLEGRELDDLAGV